MAFSGIQFERKKTDTSTVSLEIEVHLHKDPTNDYKNTSTSYRFNEEYRNIFKTALGQVPLENFVFEMDRLNRTRWNSADYDFLFRLRNSNVYECQPENKNHINVIKLDVDSYVSMACRNESVIKYQTLARFIRTGNKTQVS